jgi:cob(I)alamin adenosyltransferase
LNGKDTSIDSDISVGVENVGKQGRRKGMTLKATVEKIFAELYRLIWAIVWDYANPDRWLLDPEELFAELSCELVKVVTRYKDKPYDELKSIVIVSLRNRCIDVITMAYKTHRRAESSMMSLDTDPEFDETNVSGIPRVSDRLGVVDSYFDLDGLYNMLSVDAKALVKEALSPSDRTLLQLGLVETRKAATSPMGYWKLEMTPLILQRSLGWDEQRLKDAWTEVTVVLNQV